MDIQCYPGSARSQGPENPRQKAGCKSSPGTCQGQGRAWGWRDLMPQFLRSQPSLSPAGAEDVLPWQPAGMQEQSTGMQEQSTHAAHTDAGIAPTDAGTAHMDAGASHMDAGAAHTCGSQAPVFLGRSSFQPAQAPDYIPQNSCQLLLQKQLSWGCWGWHLCGVGTPQALPTQGMPLEPCRDGGAGPVWQERISMSVPKIPAQQEATSCPCLLSPEHSVLQPRTSRLDFITQECCELPEQFIPCNFFSG